MQTIDHEKLNECRLLPEIAFSPIEKAYQNWFAKRIDDMLFDAIAGEYGDKIIYGGKNADD